MADFSLTTLFVVPVGQVALPSSGSTQDLTAGQLGIFKSNYSIATGLSPFVDSPYFYVAQGRANTYLQSSKRSDKIATNGSNVSEWYKVSGCSTPSLQITDVTNFNVQAGEDVTLTLRAHSSYLDTLYFNGFTRSVTVAAPCLDCGDDPCDNVDANALINALITKLTTSGPGINPDNITLSQFYTFQNVEGTTLRISAKPLTKYGVPCDVSAFPFEYDRMFFRTFVYSGPATTADFIVADNCNIVATPVIIQRSSYATGTAEEIIQLEKNYYSYQAGYLKHLYRMVGYNQNFESYVNNGTTYDTYYIRFNDIDKAAYQWGDYVQQDSIVIIAVPKTQVDGAANFVGNEISNILESALGAVIDNNACITTTSTTSSVPASTTSTTSTLIP